MYRSRYWSYNAVCAKYFDETGSILYAKYNGGCIFFSLLKDVN